MSRNFIVIKVNDDSLEPSFVTCSVYTVVIFIVGQSCMTIYQKFQSLERTPDKASVLGLFPPRRRYESLLVRICSCIIIVNFTCMKLCICLFDYCLDHIHIISLFICLLFNYEPLVAWTWNLWQNIMFKFYHAYYVIFQSWPRLTYSLLCITVCWVLGATCINWMTIGPKLVSYCTLYNDV